MNKKIGFSTGSIYSWEESINKQIEILKQIGCNAIEINFGVITDINEEISEENINYIKSLDYVSIHAPFFKEDRTDLTYNNTQKIIDLIKKLEKSYFKLNAKTIIFHPNNIKDYSIFNNTKMNICIENMPIKRNISIEKLLELINKFPKFKIIIDTAHALTYDKNQLHKLIEKFKNEIQHIHFSDRRYSEYKKKVSDHQQLLFCEDIEKFNVIKELNKPIIIEANIKDKINDMDNLKKEFNFVKEFLKK